MEDRRKFIRFSIALDAKSKAAGWFQPKARYLVKDVSREGLKVGSKKAIKEGDMLELELSIPGNKRPPITALGQVRWHNKRGASEYDIGLKFKTIKPEDKFDILDYAYDKWIRSRKTL